MGSSSVFTFEYIYLPDLPRNFQLQFINDKIVMFEQEPHLNVAEHLLPPLNLNLKGRHGDSRLQQTDM